MHSRWNDDEAAALGTSALDLRVYTSHLLGQEPALVLHGGGNTSVKTTGTDLFGDPVDLIHVKGSGWDLATIERQGFAPVRLDPLRRMGDLPELSDLDMVRAMRGAMTDPTAPTPSVEAILHAIIPHPFVDHTHADAVVAVSNTPNGADAIREIYGPRVLVVPYVMPGFILAKRVRDLTRSIDWATVEGIVLLHHGVFTFGSDARSSYERMIAMVTQAEEYLDRHRARGAAPMTSPPRFDAASARRLAEIRYRVGRARGGPVIAHLDDGPDACAFASLPDMADIATRGPLTPDHVLRTKAVPCVVGDRPEDAIGQYVERYEAYFSRHATPTHTQLDPAPRWVICPGQGSIGIGATTKDAEIVIDIARHTVRAIQWAERLGGWRALPEADLFAVEYWELEQAKLRKPGGALPHGGQVALVTGAASGIGKACAEALHAAGAAVVATDINEEVTNLFGRPDCVGLVADATDRRQVEASIVEAVRRFGGLDIVVSNAGVFPPSGRIEEMDPGTWEGSLDLNLTSHLHLLRAAAPFLALGFQPSVVIVASKNVPAPGAGAAAYSVAKAGLTQLARVAALEMAPAGVRVNVVHPHQVFDTGAWSDAIIEERARHHGITAEQYRGDNLLHTQITSADVARTVLALAGPAFAKTTGAQVAVDGGSERTV